MKAALPIVALLLLLVAACGGVSEDPPQEQEADGTMPEMIDTQKAAEAIRTCRQLAFCENWMVGIVRCENAETRFAGTRSQRILAEATVVKVGMGAAPQQIQLSCFTQDENMLTVGNLYLVAACDDGEWPPAWSLSESTEVESDRAETALRETVAKLRRRLE